MDSDSGPNPATPPGDDSGDQSTTTTTPPAQSPQEAALSAENRKRRKENDALRAELDQIRASHATESEQAIAKARSEGEDAYKAKWRQAKAENLALSRLQAKGVTQLELAIRVLDLDEVDVDEAGRPDSGAVDKAIDECLKKYPTLAPTTDDGDKPPPVNGNGQRRITREELVKADASERNRLLRQALRKE